MKRIFLIKSIIILSILCISSFLVSRNITAQTCPRCPYYSLENFIDMVFTQNSDQGLPPPNLDIDQLRLNLSSAVLQTPITYDYAPWPDGATPFLYYPLIDSTLSKYLFNIGNTSSEQLKCVGLYPEKDILWAIVEIKKQDGYGGDLCQEGSYEYITFWVDWNNNGTYESKEYVGQTRINVHDIQNVLRCQNCQSKSICYAVSLKIEVPQRKCCYSPHLVKVKAILSSSLPHMNPNTNPTFGNALVRWVQIKPANCIVKLPQVYPIYWQQYFTGLLPFDQLPPEISITKPKEPLYPILSEEELILKTLMREKTCTEACCELIDVPLANLPITDDEIKYLYQCKDIEESRIEYKSIVKQFSIENGGFTNLQDQGLYEYNIPNYIQILNPELLATNNYWVNLYPGLAYLWNTKYEELKCVGVQNKSIKISIPDWLPSLGYKKIKFPVHEISAVLQVKLPDGYKGNKCSSGSTEYVRFWIDWDCDGFDPNDDIGFTTVNVHDVSTIPPEGLYFAVSRSFTPKYHRLCNELNVYPVRAILSWEILPDSNPVFKYHWGNMIDGCIQIQPEGVTIPPTLYPLINTIGGITTGDIDPNGYANENIDDDPYPACDAPFGGFVNITGEILNVPDFSNDLSCEIYASPNVSYKFEYQKKGWLPDRWEEMEPRSGNNFIIQVRKISDSGPVCDIGDDKGWKKIVNTKDPDGFYSYYKDSDKDSDKISQQVAGGVPQEVENILMPWDTTRLDLKDFNGDGSPDHNGDGEYKIRMVIKTADDPDNLIYSDTITIVIDNTAPYVYFDFTNIETCDRITKGTPITGEFTALDQHLRHYLLMYDCGEGCMDPGESGYIRKGWYQCDTGNVIEYDYAVNPPAIEDPTPQPAAPPFPTNPLDNDNYPPKPPTFEASGRYNEGFEVDTKIEIINPCGYAIKLWAWERTIRNNSYGWNYSYVERHLCIVEEKPTKRVYITPYNPYPLNPLFIPYVLNPQWPLYSQGFGLTSWNPYRYSNSAPQTFFNALSWPILQTFYSPYPIAYNNPSILYDFNYRRLGNNFTPSWNFSSQYIFPFISYYSKY